MRRTVMYAAVVASVGLFLAGLPVTGTAPPAQAQTAQDQTEWYVNDGPRLYYKGTHVGRESLNNGWNRNVSWGRVENGGFGRRNTDYTYATGGDSNSYYTYASWDDPVENQAEWRMGSRIGTQRIAVYVAGNSSEPSTATVWYQVHIAGQPIQSVPVIQRNYKRWETSSTGWANLHNPIDGELDWIVNGAEVSIWVNDNKAQPHHSLFGLRDSRIGINAVAMKCTDNCTTTPPTTTPPQASGPEISRLWPRMGIVSHTISGGENQYNFRVSPSSARVTANGSVSGLSADIIRGSGASRTLNVETDGTLVPGKYKVAVTAIYGSRSVTKNVDVTVVRPKYRIPPGSPRRIQALRKFVTIGGDEYRITVKANHYGGDVSDRVDPNSLIHEGTLSHFGRSWIGHGVRVTDRRVKVYGHALVRDRVVLDEISHIYGNALVRGYAKVGKNRNIGSTRVFGNAEVFGGAWVYGSDDGQVWVFGNAKVGGKVDDRNDGAKVYGNASVYGTAKLWGTRDYNKRTYTGNAEVFGNAWVYGGEVFGGAKVSGSAIVSGNAIVGGNATEISGNTRICGNAVVINAKISGNSVLGSGAAIYGGEYEDLVRGEECPDPITPR